MIIIILIAVAIFLISINDILDAVDEMRWQFNMLPARFWKQNYKTHRRFY